MAVEIDGKGYFLRAGFKELNDDWLYNSEFVVHFCFSAGRGASFYASRLYCGKCGAYAPAILQLRRLLQDYA